MHASTQACSLADSQKTLIFYFEFTKKLILFCLLTPRFFILKFISFAELFLRGGGANLVKRTGTNERTNKGAERGQKLEVSSEPTFWMTPVEKLYIVLYRNFKRTTQSGQICFRENQISSFAFIRQLPGLTKDQTSISKLLLMNYFYKSKCGKCSLEIKLFIKKSRHIRPYRSGRSYLSHQAMSNIL